MFAKILKEASFQKQRRDNLWWIWSRLKGTLTAKYSSRRLFGQASQDHRFHFNGVREVTTFNIITVSRLYL
jgi:hypothetical protein